MKKAFLLWFILAVQGFTLIVVGKNPPTHVQSAEEVDRLYDVGRLFLGKKAYDSAYYYSRQAVQMAEQLNYSPGHARSLLVMGYSHYHLNPLQADSSYSFLRKSLQLTQASLDTTELLRAYNYFILFHKVQNLDSAARYYRLTQQIAQSSHLSHTDSIIVASIYNSQGLAYKFHHQERQAAHTFQRSLNWFTRLKVPPTFLIKIYTNLGLSWGRTIHFQEGIDHLKTALTLAETHDSWEGMADVYNDLGRLHMEKDSDHGTLQATQANAYYQQALEASTNSEYVMGMINSYNNLGANHEIQGDLAAAKSYYLKALSLAKKHHLTVARINKNLSDLYIYFNQPDSSYFYLLKWYQQTPLNDAQENMQMHLDSGMKRILLEKQRLTIEKKKNKIRFLQYLLVLLVGGIGIFSGVFFYKKLKKRIQEDKQQQELQELKDRLERVKDVSIAGLTGVLEKFMETAAFHLHNEICSGLFVAKLQLEQVAPGVLADKDPVRFQKALSQINATNESIRAWSHALDPNSVSYIINPIPDPGEGQDTFQPFMEGIQHFCADLSKNYEVRLTVEPENYSLVCQNPPARILHTLTSVVLELLKNILDHAHAQTIGLDIEVSSDTLRLSLADDGKGFDSSIPSGVGGLSMSKRKIEEDLKGSFQVKAQMGKGTQVVLEVPLKEPF